MPFDKFLVKAVEVSRIGLLFPFYSLCYICCPCAPLSKVMVVEMLMMVVVVICKKISCWVGQGFPNSKTCIFHHVHHYIACLWWWWWSAGNEEAVLEVHLQLGLLLLLPLPSHSRLAKDWGHHWVGWYNDDSAKGGLLLSLKEVKLGTKIPIWETFFSLQDSLSSIRIQNFNQIQFCVSLVSEPLGLLPSNVWSAKQNQRNRNLIADNLFIKRHRLNVTDQRYAGGCAGSTNDRSWAIAGWACKYIFTSKSNPPSLSVKLSLKKKRIFTQFLRRNIGEKFDQIKFLSRIHGQRFPR